MTFNNQLKLKPKLNIDISKSWTIFEENGIGKKL